MSSLRRCSRGGRGPNGLKSLTAQIDVRSLAEMLGYSANILAKHAEKSGNYWGGYAAAKAAARRTGESSVKRIV